MTLIESLVALIFPALGAAGFAVGLSYGPILAVIGCVVGVVSLPLLSVIGLHVESHFTGRPHWPACRCGRGGEYTPEWSMGQVLVRCSCGAVYLRRGRQFLVVPRPGATRPYLRWHLLRGWIDEHAPLAPPTWTPYRDDDGEPPGSARRRVE